jgi:DNA polymerase III gamma/tau subunit
MEATDNRTQSCSDLQNNFGSLAFAFPQSLSEKYRPQTIAEFVGLEKPKRILSKFVAKPYPSAWLFVGPSGVGKTSMAQAMCSEIKGELHHIPSQKCTAQAIDDVCRVCHYLPFCPGGLHVVLIDEADRMTPAAQLALLSKLDATAFPPNTVFIFTANSTDGLEPRFLSRTRVIEFSSYGMSGEIASYLDRVWHAERGNGNAPDLVRLAKDSRNNVRDCLMNLETELMAL